MLNPGNPAPQSY